MRIDRLIAPRRIVDLQSVSLAEAIKELLKVVLPAGTRDEVLSETVETLMLRKTSLPGRVDDTVRLARSRSKYLNSPTIAIGRVRSKTQDDKPETCLLVVFLAPEKTRNYTEILAELVSFLGNKNFKNSFDFNDKLSKFRKSLMAYFHGESRSKGHTEQNKISKLLGKTAITVATKSECTHFFVFVDTFSTPPLIINSRKGSYKMVLISSEKDLDIHNESGESYEQIFVRAFSAHRLSQLRAAIFIGLMRGLLKTTDRVACLGGNAGSNRFDTFMVVNVIDEFPTIAASEKARALIPSHVAPEVIEKIIALASDLAVEGREGKAVGSMFIVGRLNEIKPYIEPLILNPLNGYSDDDKNIVNPFMVETIKELALIDGAFVISGDGVIDSAGSFVTAAHSGLKMNLQSGLGTRHAAACAISIVADCVAIVVSSSGQITLFRNGEATVMLERSHGRAL